MIKASSDSGGLAAGRAGPGLASGTPVLFATSGSACALLPARVDARWASALLQPQASWPLQLIMIGIITSCFGGRLTVKYAFTDIGASRSTLSLSRLTSSRDFNDRFLVLCLFLACPEPAFPSNQLFLLTPTATSEQLSSSSSSSQAPNLGHLSSLCAPRTPLAKFRPCRIPSPPACVPASALTPECDPVFHLPLWSPHAV